MLKISENHTLTPPKKLFWLFNASYGTLNTLLKVSFHKLDKDILIQLGSTLQYILSLYQRLFSFSQSVLKHTSHDVKIVLYVKLYNLLVTPTTRGLTSWLGGWYYYSYQGLIPLSIAICFGFSIGSSWPTQASSVVMDKYPHS